MAIPRVLSAGLGFLAIALAIANLFLNIVNAKTVRHKSSTVQVAATVAAACQVVTLAMVTMHLVRCLCQSTRSGSIRIASLWFSSSFLAPVLSTAASIVVLVVLAQEKEKVDLLGAPQAHFLIASAVVVGFGFASQLIFVMVVLVGGRLSSSDQALSLHTDEGQQSPQMRVKAIPYDKTVPSSTKPVEQQSVDYQSPPGSSSGKSTTDTVTSIHSSMKTRLLSTSSRTGRRPTSIRTASLRSTQSITDTDDGLSFDSWDTSAVDPHNRQTVLGTSHVPGGPPRFLETIPASPTTSRSPSPGCPLDLEPPPRRPAAARRSRSYSPAPRPPPALTRQGSASELHIHPLFRSDSPTPPPAVTPDTIITAAPDAGKVVRLRSGSIPVAPSPLSRSGSQESFGRKSPSTSAVLSMDTPSPITPNSFESIDPTEEERKMTPPIPEWILTAGSRNSLTEYQTRKVSKSGPGIVE